jgi:hypothetical protein
LRVTPVSVIQIAPRGTSGGEQLAFAKSNWEFDDAFKWIELADIAYRDQFAAAATITAPLPLQDTAPR